MKEVGDELIVSLETEEETEELKSVEMEDYSTGGSSMETKSFNKYYSLCY